MVLWAPRVLGLLVMAFFAAFALDAFQGDTPVITAGLIQLLPAARGGRARAAVLADRQRPEHRHCRRADRGAYSFSSQPIAIGRGGDVRDDRQQLLRLNHVAFVDGAGEINGSVSRRHARIELDDDTKRPRLIDDNSAQGTSVIRQGKGVPVPRGSRGLVLQSGDEIAFGQARLRVRIES